MLALCHFKDEKNSFILYDKEDLKEISEQMGIEIEKEISLEELKKDYSLCPIMSVNDLILRSLSRRSRTATHILDELGISCWLKLEQEYNKVQEKKSYLSRSQRELVVSQYDFIINC